MLIFTNRVLQDKPDESAFGLRFMPGSERIGYAQVQGGAGAWQVSDVHADATEADAVPALMHLFAAARPLLVYLHGNNNTPASCFTRCALLESLYDAEVVGFSWPSEGALPDGTQGAGTFAGRGGDDRTLSLVRAETRTAPGIRDIAERYKQAKRNAEQSIDALARFFRIVGGARVAADHQPYSVAVHSLGAHFLRSTMAVAGNDDALMTAQNVVLAAPCTRADGHRAWLQQLASAGQTIVTFNNHDTVLTGAGFVDRDVKLGLNPGGDLFDGPDMRYIDFTGAGNDFLNHDYFVAGVMTREKKRILKRLFGSERDVQGSERPDDIYPFQCDPRELVCAIGKGSFASDAGDGGN